MVEVPSFAAGGGKMGALLREHDWSKTPLGPLEIWPQSLRTTVGLVLHSIVPIVLLWGQDGTMIYNDAYSVFAGGRHPALFGFKVREGWPEIAAFNDNVMKIGLAGGTLAYSDQELTLYRSGQPEQVWMDLHYSPAPDERGNPAGVIAIVVETTARVLAERRQAAERERQRAIFQQMPGFVGVLTGPDHVFEYVNDAYVAISGPRTFVGRSVREVFPELEGQGFYELLDRVYATGKPFRAQAMPIRLVAENEDRYIDLLYEPIRNDGGEVTGIFVGGYDVTDRVRAEARRETLARLTDKLHDLTNPDDIAFTASEILGRALRVSRVGYGAIDPDAETAEVVRDWVAPGVETLAGVLPLRAYGSFIDSLKRGEFIAINDVEKDERTANAADGLKSRSARSFVNVPTLEHGRLVAVLFINDAAVRTCGRIPPRRQKEIDRLPSAVHRPIEIRPASLHPDVGFVHPPGAVAHSQMRADSLFKLRCVGLDPSEDRRVVDLDAAIEQHELQITVADGKHQIPSHGPKDHLGCELAPLEETTQTHSDPRPIVPHSIIPELRQQRSLQQNPEDCPSPPAPRARNGKGPTWRWSSALQCFAVIPTCPARSCRRDYAYRTFPTTRRRPPGRRSATVSSGTQSWLLSASRL